MEYKPYWTQIGFKPSWFVRQRRLQTKPTQHPTKSNPNANTPATVVGIRLEALQGFFLQTCERLYRSYKLRTLEPHS